MDSSESDQQNQEKKQEITLTTFLERLGIKTPSAFSRRIDCSERTMYNWRTEGKEPKLTIRQFKKLMGLVTKAGMTLDDVPNTFYPEDKENP
jgi:Txe/YoeB family toxin of Txe-Axe toxin-antitoxin module